MGTETVLYSFTGSDGAYPAAGLIADASGNLYGTTNSGGANSWGDVFKVTPKGTATVLYSFSPSVSDGFYPQAGLIADASGNLYGTTYYGDGHGYGTVFKLALLATFNGIPGQPNCVGQSLFFLAQQYGGLPRAATFGYASVTALQNAVAAHCSGS